MKIVHVFLLALAAALNIAALAQPSTAPMDTLPRFVEARKGGAEAWGSFTMGASEVLWTASRHVGNWLEFEVDTIFTGYAMKDKIQASRDRYDEQRLAGWVYQPMFGQFSRIGLPSYGTEAPIKLVLRVVAPNLEYNLGWKLNFRGKLRELSIKF